jgi:hypothetical protein
VDEHQRAHLDTYRSDLERLMHRGRQFRDRLAADPSNTQEMRAWQQECAALVNRLSGGSKAHWLARAFSHAFLLRSPSGGVVEEATAAEIVERILNVLDQARASLSRMDDLASRQSSVDTRQSGDLSVLEAAPRAPQFEFVHNAELRPVLEQAYRDSRRALEQGGFGLAFITSCGVLEAIITDALEHTSGRSNPSEGSIGAWSFETRIAAAERAGLIRGGCARLPPLALKYRDLTDTEGTMNPDVTISEREARLVGQVLRVIMRDLDPSR